MNCFYVGFSFAILIYSLMSSWLKPRSDEVLSSSDYRRLFFSESDSETVVYMFVSGPSVLLMS